MRRTSRRRNLLDPSYSKADGLTGSIAGKTGMLPPTLTELTLETHVLERAVGTKELLKVEKFNPDEALLLHVGAAVNVGKVISNKTEHDQSKIDKANLCLARFKSCYQQKNYCPLETNRIRANSKNKFIVFYYPFFFRNSWAFCSVSLAFLKVNFSMACW